MNDKGMGHSPMQWTRRRVGQQRVQMLRVAEEEAVDVCNYEKLSFEG